MQRGVIDDTVSCNFRILLEKKGTVSVPTYKLNYIIQYYLTWEVPYRDKFKHRPNIWKHALN